MAKHACTQTAPQSYMGVLTTCPISQSTDIFLPATLLRSDGAVRKAFGLTSNSGDWTNRTSCGSAAKFPAATYKLSGDNIPIHTVSCFRSATCWSRLGGLCCFGGGYRRDSTCTNNMQTTVRRQACACHVNCDFQARALRRLVALL